MPVGKTGGPAEELAGGGCEEEGSVPSGAGKEDDRLLEANINPALLLGSAVLSAAVGEDDEEEEERRGTVEEEEEEEEEDFAPVLPGEDDERHPERAEDVPLTLLLLLLGSAVLPATVAVAKVSVAPEELRTAVVESDAVTPLVLLLLMPLGPPLLLLAIAPFPNVAPVPVERSDTAGAVEENDRPLGTNLDPVLLLLFDTEILFPFAVEDARSSRMQFAHSLLCAGSGNAAHARVSVSASCRS
jgi:hypothetical protein